MWKILLSCIFITLTSNLVKALPRQQRVHGPQNGDINNPNRGFFGNVDLVNGRFQRPNNKNGDIFIGDEIVFDGPADRPLRIPLSGQNGGNDRNKFRPLVSRTTTMKTPTSSVTRNSCQTNCQTTPEYNPLCGTDGTDYSNPGKLSCAKRCGKSVELKHYGTCSSTTTAAPNGK